MPENINTDTSDENRANAVVNPETHAASGPANPQYETMVRYGYLGVTGRFTTDMAELRPGDMVVMHSPRGVDHGMVTTRPQPRGNSGEIAGNIIRRFSEGDNNIMEHVQQRRIPEEKEFCIAKAKEHKITMKIVATEHLLGGDKIIFYFLADGRVDFRELVKDLARRYRTRIEMRQIGVRDEARMLSDYEHCGRELCCRTFLRDLEPVTMRMAKMQKSTLDPSKISGHCGRLMCCLRYEDNVYQEMQSSLPHNGQYVTAGEYSGKVVNHDLSQQLEIELADGNRVWVAASTAKVIRGEHPGESAGNSAGKNRKNDTPNPDRNAARRDNASTNPPAAPTNS